jgi:hypothetical protein
MAVAFMGTDSTCAAVAIDKAQIHRSRSDGAPFIVIELG